MQHSRFHPTTTIISLMVLGLIFLNFKASNRKTSIGKQSYTGQLEPVRDTVQTLLDRGEIPSMAIGVIKDGALLWREAFGWADIEAGIEATPATIYGLGSMSKSICATGVMTREKYIQIFEPPYKPTDALKGSWQGKVHVGGEHLPITMQFDTTDTIRVRMGKEPEQVLRDATFSSHFGVLMGNMDSKIPVPEYDGEEAVPTPLTLYLDGDRLVGNATPRFSTPKGNFSYGAYAELHKTSAGR